MPQIGTSLASEPSRDIDLICERESISRAEFCRRAVDNYIQNANGTTPNPDGHIYDLDGLEKRVQLIEAQLGLRDIAEVCGDIPQPKILNLDGLDIYPNQKRGPMVRLADLLAIGFEFRGEAERVDRAMELISQISTPEVEDQPVQGDEVSTLETCQPQDTQVSDLESDASVQQSDLESDRPVQRSLVSVGSTSEDIGPYAEF